MGLVEGKAGIVTGAAGGIGRASALTFAAEGAKVVVSDIDEDGGQETVKLILAAGGDAIFVRADASSESDNEALVEAAVAAFGRLDWSHLNAGLTAPGAPVTEQKKEYFDKVLGVDLLGVVYGLKHQATRMAQQGTGGAIVISASTAGMTAQYGMAPYVTAKWGVLGLMRTAALENAPAGIRVNAICPGMTATAGVQAWADSVPEQAAAVRAKIPLGRLGTPEDQANAAVWLCSDKASYITGTDLVIDGGHLLG
ncbi:SDR family NAD(P)-dependent oxidoreductase [Winogradskya humida]|uniref:Short chain dehydrogenase n=1 Tax=Winogradskya humida TaxID=113566 RepID=A0ABQ4A5J4_9ACTN|nr:glucose 1-dehydrogenase [Actinoplanes humidus]GIE25989.1 short chain dehydrogenase [Actinoplanes humidus]